MTMDADIFVDTNVFVYARDSSEVIKQPRAEDWLRSLWENESGRISTQILNEYYVTVTQKLKPGLTIAQARSDIKSLSVWQPLEISQRLIEGAWDIQDQYGFSWWDTLVVTSALFLDCRYLLSEDLQHNQKIGNLTIINPFEINYSDLN
jgi:predicted nucleic acid-binding protein